MPLPSRPMHVPAGLPLDSSTRPELLDVGQANVQNRNVRGIQRGILTKRLGFVPESSVRSDGTTRSVGRAIFAHGPDAVPCVTDGATLDTWSASQSKWVPCGRVSEAVYSLRSLPSPRSSAYLYDTEICNGMIAVAAGASYFDVCLAYVVDASTGALISPPTTIGSGAGYISVASFSNRYFVAVFMISSGAIDAYIFDTQAPSLGWTLLANVATSSSGVIPSVCSLSDRIAVVFGTGSGTNRVNMTTLTLTGGTTTTINTSSANPDTVDVAGVIGDTIWIAWTIGTSVFAIAYDATALTIVGTKITVLSIATSFASGVRVCPGTTAQTARLFVATGGIAATTCGYVACSLGISGGAVVSTSSANPVVRNVLPASRPFCRAGRFYMVVAPSPTTTDVTGNAQSLAVLADCTDDVAYARPVANIEPSLCPTAAIMSKVNVLDTSRYLYGMQVLKSAGESLSSGLNGLGANACVLAELDFGSPDRWQSAEHHDATTITGGVAQTFDGTRVTELGFVSRPTKPTTSVATGALTGTYRYVAIYEDVDAAGNWVVSGVSLPTDPVIVTSKNVTLSVQPLSVTSRVAATGTGSSVTARVAWYRANAGNPPYYRLGATDANPYLSVITFVDSVSDTTVAANAKLYAPSLPGSLNESLDRRAPPGLRHLVSYAGMLVGARGSSILFSGQEVYGEATWFSPVFEVPIPGPGDITALAAVDGALFVFKANCIYALTGESPSDNGAAGGFSDPRLIASEVGCISATSVAVTSLGIFFQSARGLELIDRSQSVTWIGQKLDDLFATYPVVTSAVVDVRNSLVRFTLAAARDFSGGVTGAGIDVIFDLATRAWLSVDDRTFAAANTPAQAAAYVSFDGTSRYVALDALGAAWREHDETDAAAYTDNGAWITGQYTLPPWKLGLQQNHRIYEMVVLFDKSATDTGLVIEVAEDFGAFGAVTPDKVWTATDIATARQVSLRPADAGFATQLRLRDTDARGGAPSNGQGITFIGISADVGPWQGPTRATPRIDPVLRR